MEGFEVDRRSSSRQRRAAVFSLCLVAAGACLATVHLSRSTAAADELVAVVSKQAVKATVQLRQRPLDKADAYLQKHGVPSWLSTGNVQLSRCRP